jgi:Zn-dependent M28 family amino/carboxypeptidase
MRCLYSGLCALLLATAAGAADNTESLLQQRLEAHINFLADDLLLGREAGSEAYEIAANYVASQYRQMGLMPAGNEGSYFQRVPLRQALLAPGSATMAYRGNGNERVFTFVEEFYAGPSLLHTDARVEAELVFAGYGIDAPELDYNDYANLDVNGKIVVQFFGQPHDFPSEEGAHFASSDQKTRAAAARGAVGIIMIHTPRTAQRFAWDRVNSLVGTPSMGWVNTEGEVHGQYPQIRGGAMLRHTVAEPLFAGSAHSLEELLKKDETGEVLPAFALNGRIELARQSTHSNLSSPNVVAVLPGSDPLLADEYVVYMAHLDHIGELRANEDRHEKKNKDRHEKDLINNGAMDNASGVAVMLETARMFTEGRPPRRSLLFIALTGEEKGLVGAEYFAMNPTVPAASMVATINLDMPILLYEFADVIAFGAEHSSLGAAVGEAAGQLGIGLTPDPFPEQNIFVRSDHYRFVQQGIPSVYLVTGIKSRDESVDAGPIQMNFIKEHYHRPSDDLALPINYKAAETFTRVNRSIGELIANDPQRPRWNEGDFFARTYAK